jgi:protocatechuate 3,4-dioxygenase beta subunit
MHSARLGGLLSVVDSDDVQIGRVLSRREVLALMGGAALLAACEPVGPAGTAIPAASPAGASPVATSPGATPTKGSLALPACVVRPEQSEGPFFVDEGLERSDIRTDPASGAVSQGAPLALSFNVLRVSGIACTPLAAAIVDVWQCDAAGVYSDVTGNSQKFLRGHQITDATGRASFTTIYPGWYGGRAVHIHFKIRSGSEEFTSQLYFDDAMSDTVFQQPPYAARGQRPTRNASDGLFRNGGADLLLQVTSSGPGYSATFDIGLAV